MDFSDPRQPIPWAALGPLFADTWQGPQAAWQVLVDLMPVIDRAVTSVVRKITPKNGRLSPSHDDHQELLQDLLLHLMDVSLAPAGMNRPRNRVYPKNATGFLVTWIRSRTEDVLRKGRRDLDMLGDAEDSARAVADAPPDAIAPHDARTALVQLAEHLESGQLSAFRALATFGLHWPEGLERHHVDRAAAASTARTGIKRDADTTWAELVRYRGALPATDDELRLWLAWILLSSDATNHRVWHQADPVRVARARDSLRNWDRRFRESAADLLGGDA